MSVSIDASSCSGADFSGQFFVPATDSVYSPGDSLSVAWFAGKSDTLVAGELAFGSLALESSDGTTDLNITVAQSFYFGDPTWPIFDACGNTAMEYSWTVPDPTIDAESYFLVAYHVNVTGNVVVAGEAYPVVESGRSGQFQIKKDASTDTSTDNTPGTPAAATSSSTTSSTSSSSSSLTTTTTAAGTASANDKTSSGSSSSLNLSIGATAGIIVGSGVLVALLLVGSWAWVRHYRSRRERPRPVIYKVGELKTWQTERPFVELGTESPPAELQGRYWREPAELQGSTHRGW